TVVSKPITGRGRWGVRYAAHDAPGYTISLQGGCWIAFDGKQPMMFRQGDFLLPPSTPPFTLSSHPSAERELKRPVNAAVPLGHQEGDPDFTSLGGTFEIERSNAPLLLTLLPDIIHIRASEGRTDRLSRVIALIMEECASDDPGREPILQRLLEV